MWFLFLFMLNLEQKLCPRLERQTDGLTRLAALDNAPAVIFAVCIEIAARGSAAHTRILVVGPRKPIRGSLGGLLV